jgi:prolyl-tRNA synthetase
VPIFTKKETENVGKFAKKIYDVLKESYRVRLDDREGYTPGFKFNEWELKGVPIRIEIGPREAAGNTIAIVRRDTGAKVESDTGNITEKMSLILNEINKNLYEKAEKLLKNNIHKVHTFEEFNEVLAKKKGIIHAPWCGNSECEESIKKETGAKTTNIPFEQESLGENEKCVYCNRKAKVWANFARTY